MLGTTKLTLQLILGYIFYPVAWLLGVPNQDLLLVGELIGQKVIMNEFVAFDALTDPEGPYVHMAARSKLIATYACCVSVISPSPSPSSSLCLSDLTLYHPYSYDVPHG